MKAFQHIILYTYRSYRRSMLLFVHIVVETISRELFTSTMFGIVFFIFYQGFYINVFLTLWFYVHVLYILQSCLFANSRLEGNSVEVIGAKILVLIGCSLIEINSRFIKSILMRLKIYWCKLWQVFLQKFVVFWFHLEFPVLRNY